MFGRYEILETLGIGGMGKVYHVRDTLFPRDVALKIPHLDPHGDDGLLERFRREGQAAAKIVHPHVCPIYDAGQIDGISYIAMALLRGESLTARIKINAIRKQLPDQREAAEIVLKIAQALDTVHQAGIVHRDVKSSNVMIDNRSNQPVLMDFGLARDAKEVGDLTGSKDTPGTLAYMSPEQIDGRTDARSDIYSLGVVLYEYVTGVRPFDGPLGELINKILNTPPPPPQQFRSDLDPALAAIILKALSKKPADRYQTAGEMAADLKNYLQGPRPAPPKPPRRRRFGFVAVAAAAILVSAGTIIYVQTNYGTAVLTIEPSDARVTIDGDKIVVKSAQDEVALKVGQHELEVTKDDFVAKTQSFKIIRGGRELLSVRLDPHPSAKTSPDSQLLFRDEFAGGKIDDNLWRWGETNKFSYQDTGKRNDYRVETKDGCLLIEARARHERGWTSIEDVWLDCQKDFKDADVMVEFDLSAVARCGTVLIKMTDGKAPTDREDPASITLFHAQGDKYRPLSLAKQKLRIEICGSAKTATVYEQEKPLPGFTNIDLSSLSAWRLRFYASAGTSAGLADEGLASIRLFPITARTIEAKSGVAGRVIDKVTNRGLENVLVETEPGNTTMTGRDGCFLLASPPGAYSLRAELSDFVQNDSARARVSIEPAKRHLIELPMTRVKFNYGDVLSSIALDKFDILSFALAPDQIYLTAMESGGTPAFYRLSFDRREPVKIGPLSIGRGLTCADARFYAIEAWDKKGFYEIAENGEPTLLHRLNIDWPESLAYDGRLFWFLEANGLENHYGLRALDPESGREVARLTMQDKDACGLAWGDGRFWISSRAGHVAEIDIERAKEMGTVEAGILHKFPGEYSRLSFANGFLWGWDPKAKRLCKINLRDQ